MSFFTPNAAVILSLFYFSLFSFLPVSWNLISPLALDGFWNHISLREPTGKKEIQCFKELRLKTGGRKESFLLFLYCTGKWLYWLLL